MIHPAGHERLPNGTTSRIHHTDCPEQLTDPEKWIDKPPRPDSKSLSRFKKGAPTNAKGGADEGRARLPSSRELNETSCAAAKLQVPELVDRTSEKRGVDNRRLLQ